MALILTRQRSEQEAVVAVVILALLAAFVRAPAAGCAVAGGMARLVRPPTGDGVASCGHASSESGADHADAPVSWRRGRLTLDVEVLMSGREVHVRVLAQVPARKRRRGVSDSEAAQT